MKFLVTGGAGFIGTNFIYYSVDKYPEHEFTVLDSLTYSANLKSLRPIKNKIKFIEGDITEPETVDKLVASHDIIVNFAAETHNDNSLQSPENFVDTNINGMYFLLEAVRKYNKRLHHISTDEVFGDLPLTSPDSFTELSRYNPSSPYSATKAAGDLLIRAWVKSFQIEATISNCSNNYGPFQHVEKFIPRQITNLLNDQPIVLYGDGKNIRDWIHVSDHVTGIWAVINKGKSGETYLLGANTPLSNLQVAEILLDIFELDDSYLRFITDRPGHDRKYLIDSAKARRELGWHPKIIDFPAGLKNTVDWYKFNKSWWKDKKEVTEANYTLQTTEKK